MAKTYSELVGDDYNMLVQSKWPKQRTEFADYLEREKGAIERLVAYHLSLRPSEVCKVARRREWICGSFNVCVPVYIKDDSRVMVRCPLPYRFISPTSPDMAGEKLRGEAATFAWLSANCPNVPIPRLLAFGLPNGSSFTPLARASLIRRAYEWLRHRVQRTFYNVEYWRPFLPSSSPAVLKTGYLITDFIDKSQGRMLDLQWPSPEPAHRRTLFRGLANILLDLMQVPLPRIGSFTVNTNGEVTLSGRPFTASLAALEVQGICSNMLPTTTYTSVDSYVEDLLHVHDARLRDQPNAVNGPEDAEGQMATVVVLKAIRSHFIDRGSRNGPFFLQLTDLHECNIFVDEEYNITAIVDLEWSCSLPREMLQLPFWLSGHQGDDFLRDEATENEEDYVSACREFLELLGQEQSRRYAALKSPIDAEKVIMATLERKSHWYFAAVSYPLTAYSFLLHHLQPIFAPSHATSEGAGPFQDAVAPYYTRDSSSFIVQKVNDKAKYDQALRALLEV